MLSNVKIEHKKPNVKNKNTGRSMNLKFCSLICQTTLECLFWFKLYNEQHQLIALNNCNFFVEFKKFTELIKSTLDPFKAQWSTDDQMREFLEMREATTKREKRRQAKFWSMLAELVPQNSKSFNNLRQFKSWKVSINEWNCVSNLIDYFQQECKSRVSIDFQKNYYDL